MARLTSAQWALLRTQWQGSPLAGFHWLTQAGGGPWPVSREAVRQRARAEGWSKVPPDGAAARHQPAELACEGNLSAEAAGDGGIGAFTPAFPTCGPDAPEEVDDELRWRLEALHRSDWLVARRLLDRAVRDAGRIDARMAKVVAETLVRIQEGERRTYALDLLVDFDALSSEQLQAIVDGRRPRGPLPRRGPPSTPRTS
jgi:hypothetical protein